MSEPAADFTSTQSWEAIDDSTSGGWAAPPRAAASGPLRVAPRDRGLPGSGIRDSGIRDSGIRDSGIRDSGIRDSGIRDSAVRESAIRDSAVRESAIRDPGLRDPAIGSRERRTAAMQNSGVQERLSRSGVPPMETAGVTQRPGHRAARHDRAQAGPVAERTAEDTARLSPSRAPDGPAQAPGRGHGTRERPRTRKRSGRSRILLAAVLAIVVVAGGGVAYLTLARHHSATSPKAAAPKPKATMDPGPPASLGQWGYITSRTTDPEPLTLAELFPGKFASGGVTYTMTVSKADTSCGPALVGTQLQSAAQQAGCNQAMRASYLSSGTTGQVMATIGVLNLSTATGSQSTGKAAGPSETIAQLAGPSGPTASLTKGTGIEEAEVKGHYLVLVWAEFANQQAPSTAAQREQLESFISLLLQKTANVSLAIREVTGKPSSSAP